MKGPRVTRRDVVKLVGVAGAVGVVGLPRAALASQGNDERHLFIGFDLKPGAVNTGPFVMAGRFSGFGTSNAEVTNPGTPAIGQSGKSVLAGDQQFIAADGTIDTHFEGVTFPSLAANPEVVGQGKVTITGGTGAFSGVSGHGSFLVVVDFISGHIIGTEDIAISG